MNPLLRAAPSSRYTITLAMSGVTVGVPAVVLQSFMTSIYNREMMLKTKNEDNKQ